jgi:hypothetical protein
MVNGKRSNLLMGYNPRIVPVVVLGEQYIFDEGCRQGKNLDDDIASKRSNG